MARATSGLTRMPVIRVRSMEGSVGRWFVRVSLCQIPPLQSGWKKREYDKRGKTNKDIVTMELFLKLILCNKSYSYNEGIVICYLFTVFRLLKRL